MRKAGRRIWVWILSGLAMILGADGCFHITNPKVYGPPEKLNARPTPKTEVDNTPETDTIVEENE